MLQRSDLFLVCMNRLAKGRNLESFCEMVHQAAVKMEAGPQLTALKAWNWQFGMHFTLLMLQVSLLTLPFLSCCLPLGNVNNADNAKVVVIHLVILVTQNFAACHLSCLDSSFLCMCSVFPCALLHVAGPDIG